MAAREVDAEVPALRCVASYGTAPSVTHTASSVRTHKTVSQTTNTSASSSQLKTRLLGAFCMMMVIVSWVGGSEVTQILQTETDYNRPMLISWFNHISSVFIIIFQGGYLYLRGEQVVPSCMRDTPPRALVVTVAVLATIFLLGDYAWFVGLATISVGVATTIFNTTCVFVYLISVLVLREPIQLQKVIAILFAVGGVVLISVLENSDVSGSDSSASQASSTEETAAIVLTLLASFLYGVYEIAFHLRVGDWEKEAVADQVVAVNWLAFLISLFTMLVLWPAIAVVHHVPEDWMFYENFSIPTEEQIPGLVVGAAGAVAFNIFFALSLALLTPMVVSVGCTLTIPVSAISDLIFHGKSLSIWGVIGAVLILVAFCLLNDDLVAYIQQKAGFGPPPCEAIEVNSDSDDEASDGPANVTCQSEN